MRGHRSLGCRTCKRRKIKCDELEPVCFNCQKSGRECIKDPKAPTLQQARSGSDHVYFAPITIQWDIPENRRSHAHVPWNQQQHLQRTNARSHTASQSPTLSKSPCASESDRLSRRLVYTLESTKGTGFTLELAGKHWPQLPAHVGESRVLDSAIMCFLSAHTKMCCPAQISEQYQHDLYSQALREMKVAVESAREVDFEGIVAAMMVLGDFEQACGRIVNLVDHAEGAEAIFHAWGPSGINSTWALDLFDVIATALIAASISSGRKCFLDTPEWTRVFDRASRQPQRTPRERIDFEYLKIFARLGTIVSRLQEEGDDVSMETMKLMLEMWNKINALIAKVQRLMEDVMVVSEVRTGDVSSPFPACYRFSDIQVCETLCHVWKIFILIVSMMRHYFPSCLTAEDLDAQMQAAINICKCFEYVRPLKPLGAAFMHLNLPRAAAVLRGPRRAWALSAWQELVESGQEVGFDIAAPTKQLAQWMSDWNGSAYQKWWLGNDS